MRSCPVVFCRQSPWPDSVADDLVIEIEYVNQDISAVLSEIQNASFTAKWQASDFQSVCQTQGIITQIASVIANNDKCPVAYGLYRTVTEEAEILSLAVLEDFRNNHIARRMLTNICDKLQPMGIKKIFLEVAANNYSALQLYTGSGFTGTGIRKNYYSQGKMKTDALIMSKLLVYE
jgi:[ribosomal protein S18]-alanine N-acetyltransferase